MCEEKEKKWIGIAFLKEPTMFFVVVSKSKRKRAFNKKHVPIFCQKNWL